MPQQQMFQQSYQLPQQSMQMPMQYSNYSNIEMMQYSPYVQSNTDQKIRLLSKRDKDKKLVAIIVSFCNGGSYDDLFTTVEQKSLEGTQVLVYAVPSHAIQEIYDGIKGK